MNKIQVNVKNLSYTNAEVMKMGDRHLTVWKNEITPKEDPQSYTIEFKVVTNDFEPRASHCVKRNRIVCTGLRVSPQSAIALYFALKNILQKDGIL